MLPRFALIFYSVFGIGFSGYPRYRCYVCNTISNTNCGDDFNYYAHGLDAIDLISVTQNDCSCCTKTIQEGVLFRDCAGTPFSATTTCKFSMTYYTCSGDLCNYATPTHSVSANSLIIMSAVVILLVEHIRG